VRTLIIYTSKYGTTADCATALKDKLSGEVILADINKTTAPIEIDKFDTIIIGGSVYADNVSKKLRVFCQNNVNTLIKKKIGIFLCCALSDKADEYFISNFPSELLNAAKTKMSFGSEARLDKMSFLDKTILKAFTKGDYSNFKILDDRIEKFRSEMLK